MVQKVIKTGNSIALTIPSWFAKNTGIKIGDKVKVSPQAERNRIIYYFSGNKQLSLIK